METEKIKSIEFASLDSEQEKKLPLYSNSVNVKTTPWDLEFAFGHALDVDKEGKLTVASRAVVVMSPAHAKAFLGVLADNLQQYEKEFGEIAWPKKTTK
jgi:hypothetical protein